MHGIPRGKPRAPRTFVVVAIAVAAFVASITASAATHSDSTSRMGGPTFSDAVAFDTSKPLRDLVKNAKPTSGKPLASRGPVGADRRYSIEGATASSSFSALDALGVTSAPAATIGAPLTTFEGISNQDNFNLFGFRVNPPDPVGDVGPNHYVEMVNLAFAVYDKAGNRLLGPSPIGSLWDSFAIEDCTDPSGDPVVLYDQTTDRWILSQFTTRGLDPATPTAPFYNCVAVSTTADPTGPYFRYAFITQPDLVDGGYFFPDYPKYGVWSNSYIMTTRDFGFDDRYGISVYALEKNKMVAGQPDARAVQFFLDSDVVPISLIGDGLLPPDIDGNRRPPTTDSPAPIVGTQDDGGPYGATSDALNIWELTVRWRSRPTASIQHVAQLPVASFDSIFPCGVVRSRTPGVRPNARDCLPQPGITDGSRFLDILSYRQRPTYRLAYRNLGTDEALVTNQSVEATSGAAGVRWYEIRRAGGAYSLYQQGTHAPGDGVHRWMGSIAMDKKGDAALGYSVVNGTDVFPGIRYTGRLAGDPLGQMTLGEGVIVNGSGVQTTTNSRWGDYTSMNVDPTDDCTFWYVNEYYTAAGQASSPAGWQTRIGSFRLPGCS
jgi:hypothetical protein